MVKINITKYYSDNFSTRFAFSLAERGLNKLAYALDHFGFDTTINFIGAPDFSITLNRDRLRGGFVIGNIINWGEGTIPFFPVELMPNCCGTLCAQIEDEINEDILVENISKLLKKEILIDNMRINLDLGRKNHFLNIYDDGCGDHYLMIHTSLTEAKSDNKDNFGLYYNRSTKLSKAIKNLSTPYGDLLYIDGELVYAFYNQYMKYDTISKMKRIRILEKRIMPMIL